MTEAAGYFCAIFLGCIVATLIILDYRIDKQVQVLERIAIQLEIQ